MLTLAQLNNFKAKSATKNKTRKRKRSHHHSGMVAPAGAFLLLPEEARVHVEKIFNEFALAGIRTNAADLADFICRIVMLDPFFTTTSFSFQAHIQDVRLSFDARKTIYNSLCPSAKIAHAPFFLLSSASQTLSTVDMWRNSYVDPDTALRACLADYQSHAPYAPFTKENAIKILLSSAGKKYLTSLTFPPTKSNLQEVTFTSNKTKPTWQFEDTVRHEKKIAKFCHVLNDMPLQNIEYDVPPNFLQGMQEEQIAALRSVATNRVTIISGQAGSGKSFTVNQIVRWLEHINKRCFCISPYHKTVQRLREFGVKKVCTSPSFRLAFLASLYKFETKSSSLGFSSSSASDYDVDNSPSCSDGKCVNENIPNKWCCPPDVLVCDESGVQSTADFAAMFSWLMKDPDARKIVLVGDLNQMPPVTGGSAISAIVHLLSRSVTTLGRVMRVAGDSEALVDIAMNVLDGSAEIPTKSSKVQVLEKLPVDYDFENDIVITNSNEEARRYNDVIAAAHKKKMLTEGHMARQIVYGYFGGCRVIVTRGNLNGLIGKAVGRVTLKIQGEEQIGLIVSSNGEEHKVSIKDISWGYAITLNKAQGSEFKRAFVYVGGYGLGAFQNRRWIYTAVTRAKEALFLIVDSQQKGLVSYTNAVTRPLNDLVSTTHIVNWYNELNNELKEQASDVSNDVSSAVTSSSSSSSSSAASSDTASAPTASVSFSSSVAEPWTPVIKSADPRALEGTTTAKEFVQIYLDLHPFYRL